MCKNVVDIHPFMLKFVPDCYKTQKMSEKVVDACLSALKFLPDCFVTPEMLPYLDNATLLRLLMTLMMI